MKSANNIVFFGYEDNTRDCGPGIEKFKCDNCDRECAECNTCENREKKEETYKLRYIY